MTEQLVPLVRTTCTPAELYAALSDDWPTVVQDSECTRGALLVLVAHWAFETGWGHACWNWNLGNKKHVAGDGSDYYQIRCNEILGGKVVWYDPPHPATSFKAYDTIEAGVRDYLIGLRGRFRAAWPAVLAGDPAQFSHLLKLARYYTDDEAHYATNIVQCFHKLDAIIPPTAAPTLPEPLLPDHSAERDDEVIAVAQEPLEVPEKA